MNILELIFHADTHELEHAEEAVDALKDKVKDLAKEVPGLGDMFNKLTGGTGELGEALGSLEAGLATVAVGAATAFVALGAVGIAMAFKYDEQIEQINNLAVAFGYSATQTMLMKEAAERAGSSLGAVEGEYAKIAKAAYNANDPLKGTGAAFDTLGINIKGSNGELKSASELTEEAMKAWEDGSQTTADFAAMTAILGKSWQQNTPALEAVAAANQTANDLAQQGIGISTESVKAVEENTKANTEFKGIMGDVGSRLVELVIPAFTNLTTWMSHSYESGGLLKGVFGALEGATWTLMAAVRGLIGVFEGIDLVVSIIGKGIGALAASLAALVQRDWAGAKNVWVEYFSDAKDSVTAFGKSIKDLANQQVDGVTSIRTVAPNKAGNANHEGGDTKDAKEVKDPNTALEAYLATLTKQNEVLEERNTLQIAQNALDTEERYKKLTGAAADLLKQQILAAAKAHDALETNTLLDAEILRLKDSTDKYTKTIEDQIDPVTKTKDAIALENVQNQLKKDLETTLLDLKKKGLDTDSAKQSAIEDYNNALATTNAEYAKLQAYQADFVGRGVDQYVKGIGTMNDAMAKLVDSGLQGFEAQLDDLVTGGKTSFKAFAVSIIDDIAKMIVQFTIMIPLVTALKNAMASSSSSGWLGSIAGMFGGSPSASAGTATSAGDIPLTAAAGGGQLTPGTSVLVGEKGPEVLSVGAQGGYITPNSGASSSGSSNVTVNTPINITMTGGDVGNAADRAAIVKEMRTQAQAVVRQELSNALRPGGVMNRVRN